MHVCFVFFVFGPSDANLSWRASEAAILERIPGSWVEPLMFRWCRLSQIKPRCLWKQEKTEEIVICLPTVCPCVSISAIPFKLKTFIFSFLYDFKASVGFLPHLFLLPLLQRWNIRRLPLAFCWLEFTFPFFPSLTHVWLVNWELSNLSDWLPHDNKMALTTFINFNIKFLVTVTWVL